MCDVCYRDWRDRVLSRAVVYLGLLGVLVWLCLS